MIFSDLWSAIGAETGIASTQLAHGLSDLPNVTPTQAWIYTAVCFPLATAFERMGKLFIQFDTLLYTGEFGEVRKNHNIGAILSEVNRRCRKRWPHDETAHQPDGELERAVITVLTKFAESGRYHGLQTIATGTPDPRTNAALQWHQTLALPIVQRHHGRGQLVQAEPLGLPALGKARDIGGNVVSAMEQMMRAADDYSDALPWVRVYIMGTGSWLAKALIDASEEALYGRRNSNVPHLSDFLRWTQKDDDYFREQDAYRMV